MTTRRGRTTRRLAALLLSLQIVGGGFVAIAHAAEPPTGPISIEGQHDAHCAIIHDAWRCALCHYAGARMAPGATVVVPAGCPVQFVAPQVLSVDLSARLNGRVGSPRAPPAPRS